MSDNSFYRHVAGRGWIRACGNRDLHEAHVWEKPRRSQYFTWSYGSPTYHDDKEIDYWACPGVAPPSSQWPRRWRDAKTTARIVAFLVAVFVCVYLLEKLWNEISVN